MKEREPLHVIHSEDDYEEYLRELDSLWNDESELAQQRAEVLGVLIDAYEREHHAIPPPDPVEAIKFHLEQKGLTLKDLEPHIGSRTRVYEVMHHKRPLTLSIIRKLSRDLGIPAESLIE